jgi:hypothetical protein
MLKGKSIHKILFFINVLLIGGDLLSVKILDFTVRLVTVSIILAGILQLYSMPKKNFNGPHLGVGCVFLLAMILSLPNSVDQTRTLGYIAFAFFMFFILMTYFYISVNNLGENFIEWVYINSFRVQVILILVEKLIWVNERPHLWFYESSYAAIYLAAYFAHSLHLYRFSKGWSLKLKEAGDLLLSLTGLLVLMSATAMFAILLSFLLVYRSIGLVIMYMIISLSIGLIQFNEYIGDAYNMIVGFAFKDASDIYDIIHNLIVRSGTRVIRMAWGWEAFIKNPIAGIGFGADQTYTLNADYPDYILDYVTEWEDPHGNPFNNPLIEAIGTMGLFGALSMIYLAKKLISVLDILDKGIYGRFSVAILAILGAMQMEGTFLRYYLWAIMGVYFAMVYKRKFK